MNMSTWSIRNPVPALALFLVLCVVGLVSFNRLPVTQFPNIDLPIVQISVYQAGAAPSELTNQITRPIEDAVSNVSGVDKVTSTAGDSTVSIMVQFTLETDSDRALNDVKDAVVGVSLPDSANEPVVKRLDTDPYLCRFGRYTLNRKSFLLRRRCNQERAAGPERRW